MTSRDEAKRRDELDTIVTLVTSLHSFEQQLAGLMAASTRLGANACAAQQVIASKLGYLGGHQVLSALSEAQTGLAKAMTSTADGHRKLSQVGAALGYRLDDAPYGDAQKDPKSVLMILSALRDKAGSDAELN